MQENGRNFNLLIIRIGCFIYMKIICVLILISGLTVTNRSSYWTKSAQNKIKMVSEKYIDNSSLN